jgi:hypothetical protein
MGLTDSTIFPCNVLETGLMDVERTIADTLMLSMSWQALPFRSLQSNPKEQKGWAVAQTLSLVTHD